MTREEREAWNKAICAAENLAWRHHNWDMISRGRNPHEYESAYSLLADAIRGLIKIEKDDDVCATCGLPHPSRNPYCFCREGKT